MQPQQTALKTVADVGAYTLAGLTITQVVPVILGAVSIIYFLIQITEKVTGMPFVEILKCLWRRVRP